MQVDPVSRSQYGMVVELWRLAGLTRPWNDPRLDLLRAVDGPASAVLVGVEDGRLIASVMVGHDGHRGWVYYLAVHPDRRGEGHGRGMMAAAESWLRRRHISKLNLMIRHDNRTADGFYRRLGFHRDEVSVFSHRLETRTARAGTVTQAPAAVAFFPGASGAAGFWRPVADRLPDPSDPRLLSWPGAGDEPHDPTIRGFDDLVDHAAARIPDGSDVIAQSMGGVVAIGLALARPGKIRRLVLVATSGGVNVEGNGAEDWRAEYRQEFPRAAGWVTDQRIDYSMRLHRITIPTCLIWGDRDPISPLSVGRALNDALRGSVLHVIAGGTHMLARERADEVAALISAHLR